MNFSSYIAGMHNERARCQGTADGCDRIANTRVKSRSHIYINYDVTLTIRAERARKRGEARSAPIQVVNNVTSRGCCRALKAPALCVNSFFDALVSLNKPGGHAPLGENCSSNRRITPSWDFPLQHNSERRNPYASLQRRGEKITIPSGGIGRRMLSCGEDQTPAKATIQHNWRGVWSCGVQIPASVSKDNHAASCPRQSGRVRDALALLCGASSHKYLHGAGLPNFHHLPKSPPHSLVNY